MTNTTSNGEKSHMESVTRPASDSPPSERWTISPERYRQVVFVAGVLLALIVLTGAAVRLTESGLGCEDWPTCNDDQVVPEWQFHSWIEFGNRLLSGVVAAGVGAAALAAYRRRPRNQQLIRLAWGLVAGVIAQVLLGAATVLLDLHPLVVGLHFLLSMLLLWNATVLWVKADPQLDQPDIAPTSSAHTPESSTATLATTDQLAPALTQERLHPVSRTVMTLAAVAMILGTLVTGTGPHSGDARADRLPFDLETIARIHSGAVWLFLASAAWLAYGLHRLVGQSQAHAQSHTQSRTQSQIQSHTRAAAAARYLLVAAVSQGAIGYTQFLTGVPALLVELHILGAIVVWVCVVLLDQRVRQIRIEVASPTTDNAPSLA